MPRRSSSAPQRAASTTPAAYIRAASPRFRDAFAAVERPVRASFADAKPVFAHDMLGWKIPLRPGAPRRARAGTLDSDRVFVLLVERKTAITFHVWNPSDYQGLDRHRARLEEAGFEVMRGCLRHGRKGPFPHGALQPLWDGQRRTPRRRAARPRVRDPASATA